MLRQGRLSTGPGPVPSKNSPPAGEAELGKLRDYAVDMVPKFIMAGGQLVKVLIHTGVANYMEFKPVDGSYVYRKGSAGGKIFKVPTTPKEAMKSGLLGMVEKGRMAQFTAWVDAVKLEDRATWCSKGMTGSTKLALDTMSGACTRSARPRSNPAATPQQPLAAAQQRHASGVRPPWEGVLRRRAPPRRRRRVLQVLEARPVDGRVPHARVRTLPRRRISQPPRL